MPQSKIIAPNSTIFAIDFGTGAAMQIWGPDGLVSKRSLALPKVPGGRTPRDEFNLILEALLKRGDVVAESPTIGASGAETRDVIAIVGESDNELWTVSARAVKNYRKDNGLAWHKGARYAKDGVPPPVTLELHHQPRVHIEDAEIIYKLATETPWRLRHWHIATPVPRIHTSVRPSDKRGYRDDRSEMFMANLPPFSSLPADMQAVLGVKGKYSRSMVMPFAMALTEPWLRQAPRSEQRNRFLKILGPYDHGYPSFYRRMAVDWMQENARLLAGVTRMDEVPKDVRKQAHKVTQRQIRQLFHMATEMR